MKERLPLNEILEKIKTGEWQLKPVYGKNGKITHYVLRPAALNIKSAGSQPVDPRRVKPL